MEAFLLFLLYSFFGCAAENIYYFMLHRKYVSKRTLINLPLCPVYGIACLLLGALCRRSDPAYLIFAVGFLAVSAAELLFYLTSERIYNIRWWDYSSLRVNLMGGVSLAYSLLWGACAVPFVKIINPACVYWVKTLPHTAKLLLSLFAAVYFFADLKETHRELIRHRNGEKSLVGEKFGYLNLNN